MSLYLLKGDRIYDKKGPTNRGISVLADGHIPEEKADAMSFWRSEDGGLCWIEIPPEVLRLASVRAFKCGSSQYATLQLDGPKPENKICDSKENTGVPVTVEMKPMDETASAGGATAINETELQDMIGRLSRPMFQQALNTMYDEMDRRGKDLLGQMRKETAGHKMVAAIQINDGAIAKLTKMEHPQMVAAILYIKSELHPLLVGPSGCGKTYLAQQVAEALKLPYGHLTFNAGVSETWLYGRQLPSGFIEGAFSKIYRSGGVFLCDEIDAADSNLLLTLNTALANGYLYNPMNGETYLKHKDFVCIGAANTFGKGGDSLHTGRTRLDATSLDRFTVLMVDYDEKVEKVICPDDVIRKKIQAVRKNLKARGSKEVVSYRMFDKAYRLKTVAGYELKDVLRILTASWPENLAREVGATLE